MPDIPPPERAARRAQSRWLRALRKDGGRALQAGVGLPLLAGLALVGQAFLLARIVDAVVVPGARLGAMPGSGLAAVLPDLAMLLALMLVRAVLSALGERACVAGAEAIKLRLRHRLMLGHLSARTRPATRQSGAMAAAMVEEVEALDGFFVRFLPAMIQASLLPVAFAALLMPVDLVVAAILLVTAPLIPLFMAIVGMRAQAASDAQAGELARLSGFFADRLRGLLTIRLLGRASAEAQSMAARSDALRLRTFRVLRIAFLSSAVLELFAALGVAGVALYIGFSYLGVFTSMGAGQSLAAGLFCLLLAPEVYQPLRLLAAHYHDRSGALAAVAAIEAQFGEATQAPREAGAQADAAGRPVSLRIHRLHLSAPGGRTLLHDGTLDLGEGAHLAIMGRSGCGKSTLVETLAGLRPAPAGTIVLGGVCLGAAPAAWRAASICHIGQAPRLFHGTIADNIRFARPDAADDDLRRAADAALVTRFAARLPLGLDTPVGEGGYGLSGGEAHRVALARLFLRDPALILLDEPTAHLDAATEDELMDNLLAFARGRMLVLATHSTRAAHRLPRVLRLVDGHLVPCAASGERPVLAAVRDAVRENAA